MKVKLGRRSKVNLCNNLDYRLVHLVCQSIYEFDFPCDWGVFETKRTLEKQKENVRKGVSKTLNSRHIPDEIGIVRAVDIVPYIDGKYVWDKEKLGVIINKIKSLGEKLYPSTFEYGMDWGWDYPHIQIKSGKEIK